MAILINRISFGSAKYKKLLAILTLAFLGIGHLNCARHTNECDAPFVPEHLSVNSIADPDCKLLPSWQWRQPLPQGNDLNFVLFAANRFVAVGADGTILTSRDGSHWASARCGVRQNLNSVAFGDGLFVAVGDTGTILSSADGANWKSVVSGMRRNLSSVTFGKGRFVAIADSGLVLLTPEGASWKINEPVSKRNITSMAFGNKQFIALMDSTTFLTSTDATEWRMRHTNAPLRSISFTNNHFYAVGRMGTISVLENDTSWRLMGYREKQTGQSRVRSASMTSDQSKLVALFDYWGGGWHYWTAAKDTALWCSWDAMLLKDIRSVAFGNKIFAGVGKNGKLINSIDGTSWSQLNPIPNALTSIASGKNTYVAIDLYNIFTSTDLKSWKTIYAGRSELNRIFFTDDKFVIFGYGEPFSLANGVRCEFVPKRWNRELELDDSAAAILDTLNALTDSSYETKYASITHARNRYVVVGDSGRIMTSSDGRSWQRQKSGTSQGLSRVAFLNDRFWSVGYRGTILSSPDGMKWSRHISGTNNGLNDIILVDGSVPNASRKYVVVGSNGTVLTSADGSTWLRKNSTTEVDLASGVYANKHFVIFGNDGHILTSGDGKEWAGEELDSAYLPLPVSHGNGRHVAIGPIGAFLCSTDGIKWRLVSSGTSFKLSKIAFGNNAFVAVGDSGTVMVSSTGDNWTKASSATTNDLFTIAYGNGQFVATGDSGVIITSPNGTSWTRQKSTMSDSLCEITYGAGIFAALGKPAGALLTSTDGCTWSRRILCTSSMPQGVVYGNNEFLIVGENGMMLSSTPGLPPLQPDSPKADNRDRLTNDSCIGLSTDLAFEDPRVILVNAAGHIVRKTAKIENAEQFAYLQTPESFQSIQEFIPPGWVLLDSTAGDLSHDGIDDLALVMQYHDSILIDIGDVWGVVPTQPRILVIAFRDSANGRYKVMEQSNTFILRDEISNMIDPFQDIRVQDGALEIAFSFFCTMGGWGATNLSYQFRYQNAEFELIKAHIYYWMRNTGENEDTEYDFEKNRIKRTNGNNSEDEAQAKVKWSDIHLAKLRNLKTFRRPYTWEIKYGYQL